MIITIKDINKARQVDSIRLGDDVITLPDEVMTTDIALIRAMISIECAKGDSFTKSLLKAAYYLQWIRDKEFNAEKSAKLLAHVNRENLDDMVFIAYAVQIFINETTNLYLESNNYHLN